MKKHLIISLIFAIIVTLAFTHSGEKYLFQKNTGGPPAGYSGDPAGGNQNCTACHAGSAAQMEAGWITSNIPIDGYVPGATYTITATATDALVNKFGFQISAQSSTGTFLGTILNTNTQTQLSINQKYIHHTAAGTSGSGIKIWTFDWVAPDAGSGTVVFYGAFNLTNSGNNTSGDVIKLSTLTVDEDISTEIQSNQPSNYFTIFPNPANEKIEVRTTEMHYEIELINIFGQVLLKEQNATEINVSGFSPGTYILKVKGENFSSQQRVIVY